MSHDLDVRNDDIEARLEAAREAISDAAVRISQARSGMMWQKSTAPSSPSTHSEQPPKTGGEVVSLRRPEIGNKEE